LSLAFHVEIRQAAEMVSIDATLQKNFIYKYTEDLENVQRNKKKREFTGGQVSSN